MPETKIVEPAANRGFKHSGLAQATLLVLAVVMIAGGSYFSFAGWHADRLVQSQAAKLTAQVNQTATSGNNSVSSQAVSTVKPSSSVIASYSVPPNLPRYLIIPKLGVDARVLSVGVTSGGAVGTPNSIYDTAWYNESSQPGQPGAMLIDGHVSSWTARGVFYNLKNLIPGDIIQVQRGDGAMFTYKVVKSQTYNSNNVDMTAAMSPVVAGQPGLNLITCAGDVIQGTSQFAQRLIVFAQQVN